MKQKHAAAPPVERRAYQIGEFCDAWRLSRATVYRMFASGELRKIPAGRRALISCESPWIVRAQAS